MAEQKGLDFTIEIAERRPSRIRTDPQRLQQVLKNLLANAFKFTEQGSVRLRIDRASRPERASTNEPLLKRQDGCSAFAVQDTGIGIPKDKQRLIFEAFQQADGTTSRKYGGTGLGLSISREIARLLGGEIQRRERAGQGQHVHPLPAGRVRGPGGAPTTTSVATAVRRERDMPTSPDRAAERGQAAR